MATGFLWVVYPTLLKKHSDLTTGFLWVVYSTLLKKHSDYLQTFMIAEVKKPEFKCHTKIIAGFQWVAN